MKLIAVKRLLAVLVCVILVFSVFGCKKSDPVNPGDPKNTGEVKMPDVVNVKMVIADYGVVQIELYPNIAPQSACNFIYLAKNGFYNGIIFHRISKDFVVQAGQYETGYSERVANSPEGNPYTILGEFSGNGVENTLKHARGILSMARRSAGPDPYNSACSQFFICLDSSSAYSLDGNYAAFGKVVEGMDIIDNIATVECDNERPNTDIMVTSITVESDAEFSLPYFRAIKNS